MRDDWSGGILVYQWQKCPMLRGGIEPIAYEVLLDIVAVIVLQMRMIEVLVKFWFTRSDLGFDLGGRVATCEQGSKLGQ